MDLSETGSIRKAVLKLLVLLLIFPLFHVSGQKPYFRSIRMPDDIQETSISCISQDNSNYIWIGSGKGIYRFDGTDFTFYQGQDANRSVQVSAIYSTADNDMWIGTRKGDIYRFRGDSLQLFNPQEGTPKVAITGFTSDKAGNLWFSTYGEGVYYYDGNRIYNINTDDGLTDNYCYTVIDDMQGQIWVATDGGISICSLKSSNKNIRKVTTTQGIPDNIVLSLMLKGTVMWAGMQDAGICSIDTKTLEISVPKASENWPYGPVNNIVTGNNWLWVSTERNGIISIEASGGNLNGIYTNTENQNFSHINKLYADKQGNYWIASGSQLFLSLGQDLLQFDELGSGKNIHSILVDSRGFIWYSNDEGLFRINGQNGKTEKINIRLNTLTHFISLYEDDKGYVWAGTFGSGLYCIQPNGQQSRLYTESDGLSNGNILSITGKENQLWLATLGGAFKCDITGNPVAKGQQVEFTNYGDQHFPGNNYIYSVFIDSRSRVWFGTDGKGISFLEKGRFTNYGKEHGLKSNIIYSITEDSEGDIWFSTANAGIYRYNGETFRNYSTQEGLSDMHITGLLADKMHHLLIIHNNGIDILDTRSNSFLYYSSGVGLSEINPDLNVCVMQGEQVAWLGTQNGLIRMQIPEDISIRQPAIQLNKLSIFLGSENHLGSHVFAYNKNHISFHFNALWYIAPSQVRYQIRLQGYDIDWIETRDNLVTYSSLPPGNYVFEVRSSIKGDFSQSAIKSYSFTVKKPFWKTTWFIILALLSITMLVYMVIRLREKTMKQRDASEREKIMFQFQTLRSQVNPHFLFNSFSTLISIIDEDKNVAIEYVEKLSQFFRDLLEYREKDLIPLSEELKLIDTYYYLQKKRYCENLQLEIEIGDRARHSLIPPMVLQMLVENAIKHNVVSAEKPLSVQITTTERHIIVTNNLQRKKDKEPSTGIGLANIRNRYALLGFGDTEITTSEDCFTVQLPLIVTEK